MSLEKTITLPKRDNGFKKAQFILDNAGRIEDFYDLDKAKIGEGLTGMVFRATNKRTKEVCAVKSISKVHSKDAELFKKEIAIMKIMDHPNIIKLFESFEDSRNVYLSMELCEGGELFDRVIEASRFSESQAARVTQQIARAIFYMHNVVHVCHRDLKPENFLFTSKEPIERSVLKLIDFGYSASFAQGREFTTTVGTPFYIAPEVLSRRYRHECDLWSLGVITYVLLSGSPPFAGDTDAATFRKVKAGKYSFGTRIWRKISQDAKDLIASLIVVKPSDRYTAEQALQHDWIKNTAPRSSGALLQEGLVDNLRRFRAHNKLKKAALHVIANHLSEEHISKLREAFVAMDKKGDGTLTLHELKMGVSQGGLRDIPDDFQQILEGIDADGSGEIDYTEFLAAALDRQTYLQEDVCWSAFKIFDRNNDGVITSEELEAVLGDESVQTMCRKSIVQREAVDILRMVDGNGDGQIDFQEFMELMRGTS